MRMKHLVIAAAGLSLWWAGSGSAAQSLGELARQSREQRAKEGKKPVKVYTNDTLPSRPPGEGLTAASGMAATPTAVPSAVESAPGEEKKPAAATEEKAEDKRKTRDYWQGKFRSARQELARAEEMQKLAEDELSLLRLQQARELNAETQADVAQKIPAKTAQVESARAATEKARKALDDLEKEFKESGAPEEWSKTD